MVDARGYTWGVTLTKRTVTAQPQHHDSEARRPVYLDCNATTPLDPVVREEVLHYLDEEFGNAGSRTHYYGQAAKDRVNRARVQVARVVDAEPDEVFFTSGATESNNLAILGLLPYASETGRHHLVSTMIEHKAVLEPIEAATAQGFEVTLVPPTGGGWVDPSAVRGALRPDTVLVSVMGANNETGVIQPVEQIAELMGDHQAFFHVDAAQTFGKVLAPLQHRRIDLISVSGHKLFAPKGVGAIVARRRDYRRPPLRPLAFGGGQERGLRPGTLPVHLIAGLGTAADLAVSDQAAREAHCTSIKGQLLEAVTQLNAVINGELERTMAHTLNVSIPGLDSEAVIVATKELVAISNGSACTSQSYQPSHVLTAMGLEERRVAGAVRLSWCHLTTPPNWDPVVRELKRLKAAA